MANFYRLSPIQWFYRAQRAVVPLQDYTWEFPFAPAYYGFVAESWADDKPGKVADWVQSIPGQGRLHAQQFITGEILFHWDRLDPAQGQAIEHVLQESKAGPFLIALGLIGGAVALARALDE